MCLFSSCKESTVFKQDVSKDRHFGSIRWVILDFSCVHTLTFFHPKEESQNQERGSKFGSRVEISNPQTSLRGPFRPKKGPKKGPFRVLGDAGAPTLAEDPVSLVRYYTLLTSKGQPFSPASKVETLALDLELCEKYSMLAVAAATARQKLWRATPKLHLLCIFASGSPCRWATQYFFGVTQTKTWSDNSWKWQNGVT